MTFFIGCDYGFKICFLEKQLQMSDIKTELNELGSDIIKNAKSNVPVSSGALKKSLTYSIDYKSDDDFSVKISELSYGKFINNGTKNIKAQPFLTKAINDNLDDGIKEITNTLTNNIIKNLINKK